MSPQLIVRAEAKVDANHLRCPQDCLTSQWGIAYVWSPTINGTEGYTATPATGVVRTSAAGRSHVTQSWEMQGLSCCRATTVLSVAILKSCCARQGAVFRSV